MQGIKEGCPIYPLLFITAAEMLSILVKNTDFGKLTVLGRQPAINLLMIQPFSLKIVKKTLKLLRQFFSQGVKLNLKKFNLLRIHDSLLTTIYNIPVKSTIKHLGIRITKDSDTLNNLNIWNNLGMCTSLLNLWSQRDFSIIGQIFSYKN